MAGIGINIPEKLDKAVFYEDSRLKLNRMWDQAIDFWPQSRRLFFQDIPRFLQHKGRTSI